MTTTEEGQQQQQQQASEEKEPGVGDKTNVEQKIAMEKQGEKEASGEQNIVTEKEKQGEKEANGGQKAVTDKEKESESFGGRKGRTSSMDLDTARLGSAKKAGSTELDSGRVGSVKKVGSTGYLRADMLNLADLDAALDKHLARGASGNSGAPSKRKLKEWEIDPTKLILKQSIAQGTFGTVHRGEYDGQDVAIKLLDWGEEDTMSRAQIESNRNAFNQEVQVWQKLDHPNVTRFIGASVGSSNLQIPSFHNGNDGFVHVASNICCVVVEYLAGGTLKDYLIRNRRKKLSLRTVIQLALDLSRGLAYLHSKKIVHRDVKTENMLLDTKTKRVVKIADFGVARVEASNPKDMTGETGTLGYMAPEVLNGKPYNRKCDVYSFGVCLWEIYCCDMPYPDLSFAEMTHAVVHHNLRPSIPRCCPSALGHVMKKCWDANPEKRPEMSQVVELLEAIDFSKGGGMIPEDAQSSFCWSCLFKYRGP